jgi:hypothetical protein
MRMLGDRQSQSDPSGNFSYNNPQQSASRPSAPHLAAIIMIVVAIIVDNWGTIPTSVHTLDSKINRVRGKVLRLGTKARNRLCK